LRRLDPRLEVWFRSRFAGYSEIQKRALPHTLAGENTLILAPTGSGKTLAAFLSVLSRLGQQPELPNAVCAVYISPLKALSRDMLRNLEEPLAALGGRVRMQVRTGDTAAAERARQQRLRPHLLLTTPESLSTLLSQSGWRNGGFRTGAVIVDEIHAFADNKRGSLMALAVERLQPAQRIGVSATAWPVEAITGLLCGERPCAVASVDLRRAHRLEVAAAEALPPAGHNPYRVAHKTAELVAQARCSLIFTATRSAAERLGLALKVLLPEWDEQISVHHGSVDREERLAIENGLAEGTLKAVVCSSSLELGLDFSAVDQVLLIGAPRGVSRALQRLGRSGHRVEGVAAGSLVPLSLPDLVTCAALRHAAAAGRLDTLKVPSAPLDVLAQVLLGMSIERTWDLDEAFELVRRAGPFLELSREDFDSVIIYLAGGGRVLGSYGTYGKIEVSENSFRVASKAAARTFYLNAGVISDDYQVKIVSRGNRRLGEVEENFLSSLQPGEAFVIAGRSVRVKTLLSNTALVEPAQGERVKTPRWMGGKMPLTAGLAAEELDLRRDLRAEWERGGSLAAGRVLRDKWKLNRDCIDRISLFVERQTRAAPVPIDIPVQIERVKSGRSLLILFHVVAGRAVNRSLAWVLGYRLMQGESVAANFDDYAFLLSVAARKAPGLEAIRAAFNPGGFVEDLRAVLESTETLGRRFRAVAEIGQLLPRRTLHGGATGKASSWSGSLLYRTLLEHEPDHPLVKECVRGVMEDECDAARAQAEAARIFASPFEALDLPRPSPFALPLFAAFSRETLLSQDPEKALDEFVAEVYGQWA
jgi:ATP-dependent Lhr-like helicase